MSTPHPSPEYLETLMAGYLLNTLSAAENQEFERYLAQDPQLQKTLRQWQEVMGLLAHTAPQTSAPAHLRTKILQAIGQDTAPVNLHPTSQSKLLKTRQRWESKTWAIGVAAAGLVAALGIQIYQQVQGFHGLESPLAWHTGKKTGEIQVFAMQGNGAANAASGNVILDIEGEKAILVLQNLPPLPAGEVYTLWANTQDKHIFCGQFQPTAGAIVEALAIPREAYTTPTHSMQIFRVAAANAAQYRSDRLVMASAASTKKTFQQE